MYVITLYVVICTGWCKKNACFSYNCNFVYFQYKKIMLTPKQPVINAVLITYIDYSITENYIRKMASFRTHVWSISSKFCITFTKIFFGTVAISLRLVTFRSSIGRPCTAWTPENESVRRSVIESPQCSTRRRASILGLSHCSLQRILHGELNFHSYKIMIVQSCFQVILSNADFCERMLEIIASDDVILMMSDEAHFHLDG